MNALSGATGHVLKLGSERNAGSVRPGQPDAVVSLTGSGT